MKDDRVQINIKFNAEKEGDLIAYVKSLPNIQRHIKDLLQRELDAIILGWLIVNRDSVDERELDAIILGGDPDAQKR